MTPKAIADSLRQRLGQTEEQFLTTFKKLPSTLTVLTPRVQKGWQVFWMLRIDRLAQASRFSVSPASLAHELHIEESTVISWVNGVGYPQDVQCHVIDKLCKAASVKGPTLTEVLEAMPSERELQALEAVPAKPAEAPPWPTQNELSAETFLQKLLALVRHAPGEGGKRLDEVEEFILRMSSEIERLQKASEAHEGMCQELRESATEGIKDGVEATRRMQASQGSQLTTLQKQCEQLAVGIEATNSEQRTLCKKFDALREVVELVAETKPPQEPTDLAETKSALDALRAQVDRAAELTEELMQSIKERVAPAEVGGSPAELHAFLDMRAELDRINARLDTLTGGPATDIRQAVEDYMALHFRQTVIAEFGDLEADDVLSVLRSEKGQQTLRELLGTPQPVRRGKKSE